MRILFVTSTRIGDAVLSSGVLGYLLDRYPGARVTLVVGEAAAPLFEAVPSLERIVAVRKRRWKRHWLALWADAVGRRWDLVVDLRGSALAYLVPARRRTVLRPGGQPEEHRVRELARLFALRQPPAPRVWLAEAHRAMAARFVPEGGPVLAVGPAANWPGKQWRGERFAALAERLTGPDGILAGARIAVLADGHERAQARPLLESVAPERRIDLVGAVDLPTAAACLERCALFVGNDSGLMHLAAAAGTPTLGLFGPSRDSRYSPWGAKAAAVRTPESFEELNAARARGGEPGEMLMDGLTVEAASEAAEALWRRVERT